MAKVQFGAGITAITGSIGGWTFHANRSGNIVRLRSGTPKRTTPKQDAVITLHVQFLAEFQALSLTDKTSWDIFALANTKVDKFGVVRTLTGQNWYESVNQNRSFLGLTTLTTPPMPQLPMGNTNFSFTLDAMGILLTKNPPTNLPDTGYIIRTTPPLTRTTTSLRSNLRFTRVLASGPFTQLDITSDWVTAHGCAFPPSIGANNFQVGIMLQTVRRSSGITSIGNIQIENLTLP